VKDVQAVLPDWAFFPPNLTTFYDVDAAVLPLTLSPMLAF
jgi:hypothetical protein